MSGHILFSQLFISWMQRCCVVLIRSINKNPISHNPLGSGTAAVIPCRLAGTLSQPPCCAQRGSLTIHTGRPAPALYKLNTMWLEPLALRLHNTCFHIPTHSRVCICLHMRQAGNQPKRSDVRIKQIFWGCNSTTYSEETETVARNNM